MKKIGLSGGCSGESLNFTDFSHELFTAIKEHDEKKAVGSTDPNDPASGDSVSSLGQQPTSHREKQLDWERDCGIVLFRSRKAGSSHKQTEAQQDSSQNSVKPLQRSALHSMPKGMGEKYQLLERPVSAKALQSRGQRKRSSLKTFATLTTAHSPSRGSLRPKSAAAASASNAVLLIEALQNATKEAEVKKRNVSSHPQSPGKFHNMHQPNARPLMPRQADGQGGVAWGNGGQIRGLQFPQQNENGEGGGIKGRRPWSAPMLSDFRERKALRVDATTLDGHNPGTPPKSKAKSKAKKQPERMTMDKVFLTQKLSQSTTALLHQCILQKQHRKGLATAKSSVDDRLDKDTERLWNRHREKKATDLKQVHPEIEFPITLRRETSSATLLNWKVERARHKDRMMKMNPRVDTSSPELALRARDLRTDFRERAQKDFEKRKQKTNLEAQQKQRLKEKLKTQKRQLLKTGQLNHKFFSDTGTSVALHSHNRIID